MEEMILQFVQTYGWQLALIACSGIFVLGILKFFDVFKKIEKTKRKYLYTAISASISIIASAIYLVVMGAFNWAGFGVIAGAIYGLNQCIYALYENLGVRAVLQKLGTLFINLIARKQIESAKNDIIDDVSEQEVEEKQAENA